MFLSRDHMGGRRRRWLAHAGRAVRALIALAALSCDHTPPVELADPPEDVPTLAGRLLAVEAATHELSAWIRTTQINEYANRLEALDSLAEHIHRTTGFLKESFRDPGKSKAARAGVHIAWLTYDFIRIDAEATAAKRSYEFRPGCNQGLAWVGVGMQGLAKGPEWADQDEERLRVYVNAEANREHLLR